MNFITFGNRENQAIILIHGAFITEKMMYPLANAFKESYYIIIPILDGHDLQSNSIFTNIEDQARKISNFVIKDYGSKICLVYGASLGGTIATELVKQNNLSFDNAIIDAGSVVLHNKVITTFLRKFSIFQQKISANAIKKGNKFFLKSLDKSFYPKDLTDEVCKLSLKINDKTIKNVVYSTTLYTLTKFDTHPNWTYWYGEKEAFLCEKSANHFLSLFPNVKVKMFPGFNHGELVLGNSDLCIKEIKLVLDRYNYSK